MGKILFFNELGALDSTAFALSFLLSWNIGSHLEHIIIHILN